MDRSRQDIMEKVHPKEQAEKETWQRGMPERNNSSSSSDTVSEIDIEISSLSSMDILITPSQQIQVDNRTRGTPPSERKEVDTIFLNRSRPSWGNFESFTSEDCLRDYIQDMPMDMILNGNTTHKEEQIKKHRGNDNHGVIIKHKTGNVTNEIRDQGSVSPHVDGIKNGRTDHVMHRHKDSTPLSEEQPMSSTFLFKPETSNTQPYVGLEYQKKKSKSNKFQKKRRCGYCVQFLVAFLVNLFIIGIIVGAISLIKPELLPDILTGKDYNRPNNYDT